MTTTVAETPTRTTPAFLPSLGIALASAAAFGSSGPFAKSLLEAGWSPGAAVTARICIAAVVLLPVAVVMLRGRWYLLRRNATLLLTYGVVAVAAVQLAFFSAVQTLSVGVALLLEYLGVVLVVLWLWARHGQRPRRWTVVGIALAVAGLVLVLDVLGGMRVDGAGVLWALAAAVGLAAFFVLSARADTGLPPLVMATGGLVVGGVSLVVAGLVGVVPMTVTTTDVELGGLAAPWWVPVLTLSLVAAAFAYASGVSATRRLGSKVAGFVGLTEVLFSLVFAWLLLGELPLPVQLLGGVLVVAGVVAVRYDELRAVEPVATPSPVEP
ncbi:DMT family transporter [Aquipuribacter nitratireducens]|uniref:DMT family transporter n=1 Tax=Aquipuribacter nitratireducens TaxID=650104 RepID=A0ABW0GSU8_9MICO